MSQTAVTCYRCLDSLNPNISYLHTALGWNNGYVREGKALSSCTDAGDLPREDDPVYEITETTLLRVKLNRVESNQ